MISNPPSKGCSRIAPNAILALSLLSLMLVGQLAIAQKYHKSLLFPIPFDSATEKYTLQNVQEIPGETSETLYQRAKDWMQKDFGTERLDYDSLETRQLIHMHSFPYSVVWKGKQIFYSGFVHFRMQIETKEGRYRYSFTDLSTSPSPKTGPTRTFELWYDFNIHTIAKKDNATRLNSLTTQTLAKLEKMAENLRQAMAAEQIDDW